LELLGAGDDIAEGDYRRRVLRAAGNSRSLQA